MSILKSAVAALPFVLTALPWIVACPNCLAREPDVDIPIVQAVGCSAPSSYALLPRKAIKGIPSKVEIYEYDSSPVGSRQPLLLVHGLLGEFHLLFRWQELAQYLSRNQAFQDRYKIYLARFDTHAPLKVTTQAFRPALRDLAPHGGLTIVTISMSGTIIRDAMRDPAVDLCISRVLTMAAFFHGSPLFCPDWMQKSINKRHLSPLCRLDRSIGYKLYFARHKNLFRDYAWDNIDGERPAISQHHLRSGPAIDSGGPAQTPPVADIPQPGDDKFVVYAGYLHNQYAPLRHGAVREFLVSPYTFFSASLPAQLGFEHQTLQLLNCLIAGAVPAREDSSSIIYPLNDGISPISSSLLLSNDFVSRSPLRDQEGIDGITAHTDAKKARLFDNVDHLTFIEAHRPATSSVDIVDMLSLSEKPRPMFAWILKDLLE